VEVGVVEGNEAPASERKDKEAKKRKAADCENVEPSTQLSQEAGVERKFKDGIKVLLICGIPI